MKTTVELPDDLFREAKATAARRGRPLKEYMREAIEEKLARETPIRPGVWPFPPMPLGPEERARFDRVIEEEFEQIEPEDWT